MDGLTSEDDEEPTSNSNDRFFDPWRIPRSDQSQNLVQEIIESFYAHESEHMQRSRRRKQADQRSHELTLTAILCDLIHAVLMTYNKGIATTRSKQVLGKRNRYRSPALNDKLPFILDTLAKPQLGWISQDKGFKGAKAKRGQLTLIRPTDKLKNRVAAYGVELAHLGRSADEEVIILKDTRRDHWTKAKPIHYDDNQYIESLRSEIREINTWIGTADIWYHDPEIDTTDLTIRRHFSRTSFESGGRLFGGFWQGLTKAQRKAGLTIYGEPIAALDFRQMAVHILYSMVREIPDDDDLYDIPGLSIKDDDKLRSGVKKVFNAMTFQLGPLSSKPKDTADLLPKNLSIDDIQELIKARHQPIAHLFGAGVGHEAQLIESNILVDIILTLKGLGIVCLPVHDCILVQHSCSDVALAIMERVSDRYLGHPCPVSPE